MTDQEALKKITSEYEFLESPVKKLPAINKGILGLETPVEAWIRYKNLCIDTVLAELKNL